MSRMLGLVLGWLLIGPLVATADPLQDAQTYADIQELKILASDLRATLSGGSAGAELVAGNLEQFEEALDQLGGSLLAGESRTELRAHFREVNLLRHHLLEHIARGDLVITDTELELANDLFANIADYIEDRGPGGP